MRDENNSTRHICIVSPSLKMGGIERVLCVLSNYFYSKGYKVTMVSCLKSDHFYALASGIKIIEPSFTRSSSLINKSLFYPRLAAFVRKNVMAANPDSVLVFGDFFNPLVLLALTGLHYPIFISDRTSPDYRFSKAIQLGKKYLYPNSAGFIAQTRRAAQYKRNQFGSALNIEIIPNAIREVQVYKAERNKTIVYVGRFAWEKGPERLLKAFALIPETTGWTLEMAGDGPLLEPMKALATGLGVANRVVFHGKVTDVDKLLGQSSIYVIPSVLEGFPNALCEAMAAGLPCVCFDSIPYEDILEPEISGVVIPDGDIDKLAFRLLELISSPSKRIALGEKAQKAVEKLKVEHIGDQFLKFMSLS